MEFRNVSTIPFVIGTTRIIHNQFCKNIDKLPIRINIDTLQKIALLKSCQGIVTQHLLTLNILANFQYLCTCFLLSVWKPAVK